MSSPLVERFLGLASANVAIADERGETTFDELVARASFAAESLRASDASLAGRRVVILASPGASWVASFFGVTLAGGVAVPLSPQYPPHELAWFADDARADTVILSADLEERGAELAKGRRALDADAITAGRSTPQPSAIEPDDTALFLYTSGTTGKPKGAMITHANVATQTMLLRETWKLSERDALLHALPLHHLHGLGISLLSALLAGARARMLPRFDAARVWQEMERATVWMAVPTMYQKLFEALDRADEATRARWTSSARGLRLATSGSAALPVTLAERWRSITGAIPLERFGMTEIGVGMTNPLEPSARRPGSVGLPPRTVEHRIVDESDRAIEHGSGELWIRGPSVFKGYFGREDATKSAFAEGGWFKTGDVAVRDDDGYVRLLGRTSVDILKSGGYKLSALEIEEALREHAAIAEVAVVGLPDETWGDRVVAVVVPIEGRAAECASEALRAWAKERMAAYKVPREVVIVKSLPRNALGKVVKPELVKSLTSAR